MDGWALATTAKLTPATTAAPARPAPSPTIILSLPFMPILPIESSFLLWPGSVKRKCRSASKKR